MTEGREVWRIFLKKSGQSFKKNEKNKKALFLFKNRFAILQLINTKDEVYHENLRPFADVVARRMYSNS